MYATFPKSHKTTKNTLLTKNKLDASAPGHRRQFYFIFSCSQARKKIFKKLLLRSPLPLRLRHLILLFDRMNNTYVTKNENKIKVIPHQYKRFLN